VSPGNTLGAPAARPETARPSAETELNRKIPNPEIPP
jgi:hypothetical protein